MESTFLWINELNLVGIGGRRLLKSIEIAGKYETSWSGIVAAYIFNHTGHRIEYAILRENNVGRNYHQLAFESELHSSSVNNLIELVLF